MSSVCERVWECVYVYLKSSIGLSNVTLWTFVRFAVERRGWYLYSQVNGEWSDAVNHSSILLRYWWWNWWNCYSQKVLQHISPCASSLICKVLSLWIGDPHWQQELNIHQMTSLIFKGWKDSVHSVNSLVITLLFRVDDVCISPPVTSVYSVLLSTCIWADTVYQFCIFYVLIGFTWLSYLFTHVA